MKTHRVLSVMVASIVAMFAMTIPAKAAALDAATTGSTVASVVEGGKCAYYLSVISQMAGRAGTATAQTAKGIAFEILEKDILNLQGLFSGVTTKLSESSIDQAADLVSIKDGKIVGLIQCKDTPNSWKNVLRNIDKYQSTDIYVTTETAQELCAAIEGTGANVAVIDSGISTKTTSKIGRLYKGSACWNDLVSAAEKSAGVGGALSAVLATAEAIYFDYDFDEAIGHIVVETAEGTTIAYISSLATTGAAATLAAGGFTGAAAIAAPVVVGGAAALASGAAINYVSERTGAKDVISKLAASTQEFVTDGCHAIQEKWDTMVAR